MPELSFRPDDLSLSVNGNYCEDLIWSVPIQLKRVFIVVAFFLFTLLPLPFYDKFNN